MSRDEGPVGARLRAARRRAGLTKPPPKPSQPRDIRTVSDVRAETARRERAKRDFPTPQSLASPAGIARLRQVAGGGIFADIDARNRRLDKSGYKPNKAYDRYALAPLGILAFGDPDIKRGFRDTRRLAGGLKDVLLDPDASRREKVEAAAGTAMIGGALGGGLGTPRLKAPTPRRARYKDLNQQFPNSTSLFTRNATRLLDRFSERLSGTVDTLRGPEAGRLSKATGAVLTPASTRARVPKQAGKMAKKEATRRRASQAQHIRDVKAVGRIFPGLKTEPAQAAHWWLAQVPKAARTPETFKLIKAKQLEGLDELVSGRFSAQLGRAENALRAERRAASESGDMDSVWKLNADLEDVNNVRADIPERIKDLTGDVRKLDRLIVRPPKIDPVAMDAMDALMRDRQDILTRAGVLDPDKAAGRQGLVSRWLGLESDGSEVYVGHRVGRVKYQRESGVAGNVALGKTSLPQGVATQNELKLLTQGRARKDVAHVIEDWQAAQVYDFHNLAKDELGKMGQPLTSARVPKGYALLNPRGHEIPRTMRTDPKMQAAAEGFDEDVLIGDATEYLDNYLTIDPVKIEAMLQKARESGHLADLRLVPVDVVKRYYSQFLPTKVIVGTPGVKEGTSVFGKGADWANDAMYTSLIYSNPGYIPAAFAANEIMAVAQQGVLHPGNLSRGTQLLASAPAKIRDLARAEFGGGGAAALASETSPLRKIGGVVSEIGDEPFRASAFIHEAARVGVLPKAKPYLDTNDYAKLEKLLTDPEMRPLLNDISVRTNDAMLDFNRLGSKERAFAKRALFVWGFLRAAARHPGRFAIDHPVRTAAGAGAAYAFQDDIRDATPDGLPSWMSGSIGVGDDKILQTRSYDPTSPPLDMLATAFGDPDARTFLEFMHPLGRAGVNIADKRTPTGFSADSYRESLQENAKRLVPWVDRASNYINPPEPKDTGVFPEDASRSGRLKRDLRVIPIKIDKEEAREVRQRELARQGRSKPETLQERRTTMLAEERKNAEKIGQPITPEVREAVNLKAAIEAETDRLSREQAKRKNVEVPEGKRFKLTPKQKVAAALAALRDNNPGWFNYSEAKAYLDSLTSAKEAEAYLDAVRRDAYGNTLRIWHKAANDAAG